MLDVNPAPLESTTHLFWTPEALREFQEAWDSGWDGQEPVPNWVKWLWKANQSTVSTAGLHHKTQEALDKNIERLYAAARTGCNLTLTRVYYQMWSRWIEKENDTAADYLADAWDAIATAQIYLAKRWGAFIEWHVEDVMNA